MRAWKTMCVPVLALMAAAGCGISIHGWGASTSSLWGQDVEVHEGYLVVDDVRLEHERWDEVELSTEGMAELRIGVADEPLRLAGAEGRTAKLRVHVYSEYEGDGTVVFEEGRLTAHGERGKAFVNSVDGTIPADVDLVIATGTGPITLAGVASGRALELSTGTGEMELDDVAPELLHVSSGTGDLRARGGGAGKLVVETGTGDVRLSDGSWGEIRMETGTGNVRIKDCKTAVVRVSSGTGDLILDGGACGKAQLESGTGNLVIRGGAEVEEASES